MTLGNLVKVWLDIIPFICYFSVVVNEYIRNILGEQHGQNN
jgi:hypothetical protein